jgi:hypothetical protein
LTRYNFFSVIIRITLLKDAAVCHLSNQYVLMFTSNVKCL